MCARVTFLALIIAVASIEQALSFIPPKASRYVGANQPQTFDKLSQHSEHHDHTDATSHEQHLTTKKAESEEKSAEQKYEFNVGSQQHTEQQETTYKPLEHHDHDQDVSYEQQLKQGHVERTAFHADNLSPVSIEIQETTTMSLIDLNLSTTAATTEQVTTQTTQSTPTHTSEEETHQDISATTTTPEILAAGHGNGHSDASRLKGFSALTSILVGVLVATRLMSS